LAVFAVLKEKARARRSRPRGETRKAPKFCGETPAQGKEYTGKEKEKKAEKEIVQHFPKKKGNEKRCLSTMEGGEKKVV